MNTPMNLPLFELESNWRPPKLDDLPNWKHANKVGIDTETKDEGLNNDLGIGVRMEGSRLVGVSFCLDLKCKYYLPIAHENDSDNIDKEKAISYFRDQAQVFNGELVGANIIYDLEYLAHEGVFFKNAHRIRCIQINDTLINENHFEYSLEAIAKRNGFEGKSEDLLREASENYGINPKKEMWRLPSKYVGEYAEDDAELPLKILDKQEAEIKKLRLENIYDLESRLIPCLLDMTRRGVRIDQSKLAWVQQWAIQEQQKCINEIKQITGFSLGMGDCSTPSIVEKLLQKADIYTGKTPSGNPRTDKETLEGCGHPAIEHLLRARRFEKVSNTYVDGTIKALIGDRIYPNYNQLKKQKEDGKKGGTISGRLSSSNPNIQNQPSREEEIAPVWRSIYLPDTEMFCSCDYSQQEPRIITHYAEILGLRGAEIAGNNYRNNPDADFHQVMMELTSLQRKPAKAIFLGLCYGMGEAKLCRSLGFETITMVRVKSKTGGWEWVPLTKNNYSSELWTKEVAGDEGRAILDQFDSKAPFVKLLDSSVKQKVSETGFLRTLLGRRRNFPLDTSVNYKRYLFLHKSLNALIQGSASDQMKLAMVNCYEEGVRLQLQVHDELDWSIERLSEAKHVKEIMEQSVTLRVPSKVDVEIGKNWGSVRKVEL